jgi:predicted CoA-substrate-specific enzyme activase
MYFAGMDIGSVAAKFLIMQEDGEVLAYVVEATNPNIEELAEKLISRALQEAGLQKDNIAYAFSTGYGRYTVSFAQENRTEIICHATGVHSLFPSARMIVDIGGQDSKVIRLNENGKVINFSMNTRCAAGTGRFTEVMSKALGVALEEWGAVVESAEQRTSISNICTVFAESEVISKIMQKVPLDEIVAGVCESICTRIVESVQRAGGVMPDVAFTGGVANNLGIRKILEEKLGVPLLIPAIPQSTGALGAAHLARAAYKNSESEEREIASGNR